MANLDDLDYKSILNMESDESIETIRQVRLRRRIPSKPKKSTTKKKDVKVTVTDSNMAAKLLEILGGNE